MKHYKSPSPIFTFQKDLIILNNTPLQAHLHMPMKLTPCRRWKLTP